MDQDLIGEGGGLMDWVTVEGEGGGGVAQVGNKAQGWGAQKCEDTMFCISAQIAHLEKKNLVLEMWAKMLLADQILGCLNQLYL